MRNIQAPALYNARLRLADDLGADFTREVIEVPGVTVAHEIGDGEPAVGPVGEKALEADKSFRDKVAVLDKGIEHIADEEKLPAGAEERFFVSTEEGDGVAFGRRTLRSAAAPEVEIG